MCGDALCRRFILNRDLEADDCSYCEHAWNDKGDKLHETNLISSSLGPLGFTPAAAVLDVAQWGGNGQPQFP